MMHRHKRLGGPDGVRARALAAASQLLAERGVEEVSLRAIAERADIGLASIYHHFDSKEDLLLRLALRGFAELRAAIEVSRNDTDLDGPMRRAARAFLTFADTRAPLFALMFDPPLLSRHTTLREAEEAARAAYVDAVMQDDRLPQDRRADCAMAIWALGRGMTAVNTSFPDGKMPRELFHSMSRGIAWLIDR